MPVVFNEDDHFDFDIPMNNFVAATSAYASWGFFDFRQKDESFDEGYQSVPVNWKISSPRKRGFFNKLKDDGFDDKALGRIFIPIGIEIGSETPEEIAVSIVAELIQKRSQNIELHSSFAINDKTL